MGALPYGRATAPDRFSVMSRAGELRDRWSPPLRSGYYTVARCTVVVETVSVRGNQFTKIDYATLGPEASFSGAGGYKGDVSALFRGQQQHVRIGSDRGIAHRVEGDERIVLGVNDQSRNADAADEGASAGFGVVIIRVSKTKMWRHILVVELLDAANAIQQAHIVTTRKQFFLNLDAVFQTPQKVLLINPVAAPGHQSCAGAQINRRRNHADRFHFRRRIVSILTGEFQNHVAAQRKARDQDTRQ